MGFKQGHALVIGVGTYHYEPQLDVPVASRDAKGVNDILLDRLYCGYPEDQVITLLDEQATRDNILNALDQIAFQAQPEDTVFVFHCGHGDHGTDGNYYLLCHDSQVEGNKVARDTGIHHKDLLQKLHQIKAKRFLLILNSCHSGAVSPSLSVEETFGGRVMPGETAEALLATGSGRILITACREQQLSWIGKGERSIFTQALTDALQGKGLFPRGGYISAFDLYTAIYESVSSTAEKQLKKSQEPELTILKGVGPFAVALYKGATHTNLGAAEEQTGPLQGAGVRSVEPERSRLLYQHILGQSGGINFGQENRIVIQGDITAGDRFDARGAQGVVQQSAGPVEQKFDNRIHTGGGAYVGGSVTVQGGDFVGRDKVVSASLPSPTATLADFLALLEQLGARLDQAGLEDKIQSFVQNEIDQIQVEANEPQPSLPIIEAKLTSIQALVQKTASVVSAVQDLAQIVQRAIVIGRVLFS